MPEVLPALLTAVLIPVLCVSRFQLIFGVILAVLTFMTVTGNQRIRYLIAAAAALIPLYIVLTIARSHDVAYLNGIFEMKNPQTPIFVTQPYMYIANNYDNFNCLVEELPRHSLGLKGMFPLWAFTGVSKLASLYHKRGADDGYAVLRRVLRFRRGRRDPFRGGFRSRSRSPFGLV